MVMNGHKVLRGYFIAGHERVRGKRNSFIVLKILDELRVLIGALDDVLFIRLLQQSPEFARSAHIGDSVGGP